MSPPVGQTLELPATRTVAVVVTYFPTDEILGNAQEIARQVERVIVIDNGSRECESLLGALAALARVELHRNPVNLGIAAALNIGVHRAREMGAQYVVTFDQDSSPSPDLVSQLVSALLTTEEALGSGTVGIMGPLFDFGLIGPARPEVLPGIEERDEIIQSGSLYPAALFDELGSFDESLFIDAVDTEFCLRVRASGRRVLVSNRVRLSHHRLGQSRAVSFGFRSALATGHSPLRRYYITRNRLRVLARYGSRERRWALLTVRRLLVGTLLAVSVESERLKKVRATCLGIVDALRRRTGPAPRSLSRESEHGPVSIQPEP